MLRINDNDHDEDPINAYNDDYFHILSEYTTKCLISENELDVLQFIVDTAINRLGFNDFIIYLIDQEDPNSLVRGLSYNLIEQDTTLKIKIGEGIVGTCAATLESIRVDRIEQDSRYLFAGYHGQSELSVPIMHDQKLIGVIDSENKEPGFFSENHEMLLSAMANVAAITILKLRRTSDLQRINVELEKRVQIQTEVLKTALKELQMKNESLTLFSSSVSHDLKSPLRTISSFAELGIRNINKNEEKLKQYLSTISNISTRAYHMVNEIMSYGQINEVKLKRQRVDLYQDILEPVYDDLAAVINQKNGTISIIPGAPHLHVDPMLIKLLFQNLFSNSLKFRKPSVSPEIIVEATSINRGFVTFNIRDNGIGIDPMMKNQMFKPFHKGDVNQEGFGLGLATCMSIVEKHSGAICLDESYLDGAAFNLTLPIWQKEF